MPFTWEFNTGTYPSTTELPLCHRGPMIDVEAVMSQPFGLLRAFNDIRALTLQNVVSVEYDAVRTREVLLRSINGFLGPVFVRLNNQRKRLQVRICEKRHSVDIDTALSPYDLRFQEAINIFPSHKIPKQHQDLFRSALRSNNAEIRVSGRCAVILLLSFIELDSVNA